MRHILFLIFFGAIAAISFSVSAYLVLGAFKPEAELHRMLVSMEQTDTVLHTAGISWTRGDGRERKTTTIYTKGQIDWSDPEVIEHDTNFRVVEVSRVGDNAELSGDIWKLEDTTYIHYLPPGPDINGVTFEDGEWFVLELDDLELWGPLIPGLDVPLLDGDESWSKESLSFLRYLLARADIFTIVYADITELIGTVQTRIFEVAFDPDALKAFSRDMLRAQYSQSDLTNNQLLIADSRAEALKDLKIRFWIGTKDHLLYRAHIAGILPEQADQPVTALDILVQLEDYNSPFDATAPTRTKSFDAIYLQLLGKLPESSFGGMQSDQTVFDLNARLPGVTDELNSGALSDIDEDGLSDLMEGFYGSDRFNPDTDGDGVSDGEEVLNGRNPRGRGSLFGFGLDVR